MGRFMVCVCWLVGVSCAALVFTGGGCSGHVATPPPSGPEPGARVVILITGSEVLVDGVRVEGALETRHPDDEFLLPALLERLNERGAGKEGVTIRTDKDVSFRTVAEIVHTLGRAGLDDLIFEVNKSDEASPFSKLPLPSEREKP